MRSTPTTPALLSTPDPSRRRLLQAALALLAGRAPLAGAQQQQQRIPIADMHSHYGMVTRTMASSGLAEDMRSQRVALVAWKLIADARWIRAGDTGISQVSEPAPGALAEHFNTVLGRMKAYLAANGLKTVLTAEDVDACIAGEPGIVLASEGADFLEGQVDKLDAAYQQGLRHLQLVHYIRTPVGDFQTVRPVHNGLSDMGKRLIEACNQKRILVDLAHSTGDAVDQALAVAKTPVVWSHGWVTQSGGNWLDRFGYLQRRLSLDHARKIADRGGVIGLWGLALSAPSPSWSGGWSVGRRDTQAYAKELANLVDKLGADHVAFGTDIEGVGPNWSVNDYAQVRSVVDHLQEMKLASSVIERLAFGNYARVLKAVL